MLVIVFFPSYTCIVKALDILSSLADFFREPSWPTRGNHAHWPKKSEEKKGYDLQGSRISTRVSMANLWVYILFVWWAHVDDHRPSRLIWKNFHSHLFYRIFVCHHVWHFCGCKIRKLHLWDHCQAASHLVHPRWLG